MIYFNDPSVPHYGRSGSVSQSWQHVNVRWDRERMNVSSNRTQSR